MKRIDEIRERCNAATEGPWGVGGIRKNLIQTANAPFFEVCTVRGGSSFRDIDGQQKANADFIAHSREDIPYLLREIEEQETKIEHWSKQLSGYVDQCLHYEKQLAESQRREQAAVEDLKAMANAMRESEELPENCCFACIYDAQNLPDNTILAYGECPGYERDDCFEWRGPQEKGDAE